jgi:cell division septation protein DedD
VAAKQAAAPKPAPVAAPAVEKHTAASGNTLVQLTAVSSEDAAKSEWQRLSKRMPDLLGQRKPAFSKTEHDGRTLWRVRTGGFSDLSQATSFCEKIRAKGVGCAVAEF